MLLIIVIILNLLVTLVERLGDRDKGKPHPILAIKSAWKSFIGLFKRKKIDVPEEYSSEEKEKV